MPKPCLPTTAWVDAKVWYRLKPVALEGAVAVAAWIKLAVRPRQAFLVWAEH